MLMISDQVIRNYLLGVLPSSDCKQFEEHYFRDGELFERLQIIEAELIEDYVYRRLSNAERQSFERHFQVTLERRERVDQEKNWRRVMNTPWWESFIRWLKKTLSPILEPVFALNYSGTLQHALLGVAAAATALVLLVLSVRFLNRPQASRPLVAETRPSPIPPTPSRVETPLPQIFASLHVPSQSASLGGGSSRVPTLTIAKDATGVELTPVLPRTVGGQTFLVYDAKLYRGNAGGVVVWSDQGEIKNLSGLKLTKEVFANNGVFTLLLVRYKTEARNTQQAVSTRHSFRVVLQ